MTVVDFHLTKIMQREPLQAQYYCPICDYMVQGHEPEDPDAVYFISCKECNDDAEYVPEL